jgi:uracil DNA glycosylase
VFKYAIEQYGFSSDIFDVGIFSSLSTLEFTNKLSDLGNCVVLKLEKDFFKALFLMNNEVQQYIKFSIVNNQVIVHQRTAPESLDEKSFDAITDLIMERIVEHPFEKIFLYADQEASNKATLFLNRNISRLQIVQPFIGLTVNHPYEVEADQEVVESEIINSWFTESIGVLLRGLGKV